MKVAPKVKQTIFASASLLNMMTLGMMYGYTGILLPSLLVDSHGMKVDKHLASWIAGLPGISGLLTVITAGPLMHVYGRKVTQIVMTTPILIGWILTFLSYKIETLLVARALQGLSSGLVYFYSVCIAELTSPSIRGLLLNLKVLATSLGIFLIHSFGYFLHWRSLALVATAPCLLSLLITMFWPQTPDWLVSKGRYKEAEAVFFWLRGQSTESEREIQKFMAAEKARRESGESINTKIGLKCFRSKVLWRPVILLCCAILIPEVGGRHFFPAYSLQLAEQISGDRSKGFMYTIIIDLIGVFAACVSSVLISRFPRRSILFYCGYIANVFLLASCFIMLIKKVVYNNHVLMWVSISLLGIYFLIVYGSTFGVCYALMGELFPLEYRALGTVLDGTLSCIILTAIMKLMPILRDLLDIHGMFFVFSISMLVALTYMFYDLPETKERTLHDISEYFRGKAPKIRSRDQVIVNCEQLLTS